ncbi:MAG: hypothetical protein ACFCUN_12685 [Hyphomicrobiaceae bacterium]
MPVLNPARSLVSWGVFALLLAGLALPHEPAAANWLTRLLGEAAEVGGKAAGRLDPGAARYIARLPDSEARSTLFAAPAESGHWRFKNAQGETFTASTPDEVARAIATLGPDGASAQSPLTVLLERTALTRPGVALDILPERTRLAVLIDGRPVPLKRPAAGGALDGDWVVEVRSNLVVPVGSGRALDETFYQLGRRIAPSQVRVISLRPDGPQHLNRLVQRDQVSRRVLADPIAAERLAAEMPALRGQTAVLTGRIDGTRLIFRTAAGSDQAMDLAAVRRAAADHDVNLIVLHAQAPRQPGTRNWLWQVAEVDNLDAALGHATVADFLNAVSVGRGRLRIEIEETPSGRTVLRAEPIDGAGILPGSETANQVFEEFVAETVGRIATAATLIDMTSMARQRELDQRYFVAWLPSWIQLLFLVGAIAGVIAFARARTWWFRLWPPERREDYPGVVGYQLARLVRLVLFLIIALPILGIPALIADLLSLVWLIIALPFLLMRWMIVRITRRLA